MGQPLFTLLLFTGVVPLALPATRNYHLVQNGKNWTDARTYCQATHTDLAIIKSSYDLLQLQNEAQSQIFSSSAWIGLYNDNSWHWSFGYEPLGTMRKWDAGEPNNRWGKQNCGAITPWGWWDLECSELLPSVCFDGKPYIYLTFTLETKTGNDRYIYISNHTQCYDAEAYCRQHYTDLASTRDENEYSVVVSLVSYKTWIGLLKDPWKWVDHTNFSYISWSYGKPDNYLWDENCGYLDMDQAADAWCSDIMPFFCYKESKKQQTVRMKIKSDQDLKDPAVSAAILEKIKQKLSDHGAGEDVVVKWRAKADGEVFHKERKACIAEKNCATTIVH